MLEWILKERGKNIKLLFNNNNYIITFLVRYYKKLWSFSTYTCNTVINYPNNAI